MSDFETRLERLEEIATKLRDGTVRIDSAAALFEEGMTISRGLEKELRSMERRVEILVNESMKEDTRRCSNSLTTPMSPLPRSSQPEEADPAAMSAPLPHHRKVHRITNANADFREASLVDFECVSRGISGTDRCK
jgi:exodeoxyribonuclease VII small subunit